MFTSTLLTMMAIGGFPSFVEDMKVNFEIKSARAGASIDV